LRLLLADLSQPRDSDRIEVLLDRALPRGGRIGTVGWKYWTAEEVGDPEHALEIPSLLADLLRGRADEVVNATDAVHAPGHGAAQRGHGGRDRRGSSSPNHMAAAAVRRMAFALREGMTDFAAVEAGAIGGLPLGCHVTFATGPRPFGLSGPTGARLERGGRCRSTSATGGRTSAGPGGWPRGRRTCPGRRGTIVEAFVGPYLEAMSLWCG
jgi:hypothetical protein